MRRSFSWFLGLASLAFFQAQHPLAAQTYSCFGPDISPRVQQRILTHLQAVEANILPCTEGMSLPQAGKVLVFGQHPWQKLGSPALSQAAESFQLSSKTLGEAQFYFASGQASQAQKGLYSYGSHLAAYALLEELGFAFLHPLEPYRPQSLHWPNTLLKNEAPHWPVRAFHLHTQHPIELTNMLNGWSEKGYEDPAAWAKLLPEWEAYLEWMLANRQNHLAWYLLRAESWAAFADSAERQQRLKTLVDLGHDFSLAIGVTAPLAYKQQHAWTMIRQTSNESQQIESAIDWLSQLDLDYIEIEMGTSEFTHPPEQQMLDWMNHATAYADDRYGIETWVKIHTSTGQTAEGFQDPDTGKPLNFNFLPYYADPRLGVMAHTVQLYGLNDPAPTYGNQNFSEIQRYMAMEAGRRKVLFYPETAYWVSFDIDVPLFLPIYGERRLQDLRLLAQLQKQGKLGRGPQQGSPIQGQVNFSSGWEWAYWLHDVMSARAAWNPYPELSDAEALDASLEVFTRIFADKGPAIKQRLVQWITQQKQLLIYGEYKGQRPASIEKRSGLAYLAGVDAWDDIAWLLGEGETQAQRKGLMDMRNPLKGGPGYDRELKPLLRAMRDQFQSLAQLPELKNLEPKQRSYGQELLDAMQITALRAKQVSHLYESVDIEMDKPWAQQEARDERIQAQSVFDEALELSHRRALSYRLSPERLTSWQYGPSAYHFSYLWAAHSLYYWWRDEEKLTEKPLSPCYRNIIDPIDIAHGESPWNIDVPILGTLGVQELRDRLAKIPGLAPYADECLKKPKEEPRPRRQAKKS